MSGGPYGRGKSPARACVSLKDWPEPDRKLWLAALAQSDPLAEEFGARARHRPRSNYKVECSYGRWLTFAARQESLQVAGHPADRITADAVRKYVRELETLGNKTYTILGRLQDLGAMAKILSPERDWRFINRISAVVRGRRERNTGKRARLVTTDKLVTLGLQLIASAAGQSTRRLAAMAYRDGLIISLLALRPLRRRNLVGLTIGNNLIRVGAGWVIAIPPSETKTHTPLEFEWPTQLHNHLEIYLAQHRPVLLNLRGRWHSLIGDRLWVSSHGSPLTEMALYEIITKHTSAAFGHSVNPNLFRDAAATTTAIHDPNHVRLAAPLLGHRSFATTERYYQQAQTLEAQREYVDKIINIRRQSKNSRSLNPRFRS